MFTPLRRGNGTPACPGGSINHQNKQNESGRVMRAAVIDIGSNSIKLIVGQTEGDGFTVLEFLKNIVPIGKNTFFRGGIAQSTTKLIIDVLERYKKTLQEYEVTNVTVVATTAVREAANKDIFVDTIQRKTGWPVDVLTVGDVVYYIDSYLSFKLENTYPIHGKNVLIAELGSGSLDISAMEKGFTLMNIGLPIGTLRVKQLISKLDGGAGEVHQAVEQFIANEFASLKRYLPFAEVDDVILLDETYAAYLDNVLPGQEHTAKFSLLGEERAQSLVTELSEKTSEEIMHAYRIPFEIAETIDACALVLKNFVALSRNRTVCLLETSLAEAVLANLLLGIKLSQRYDKTNQLMSIAQYLCRKYQVDYVHARHVADLCRMLFSSLKEMLGLRDEDLLYLLLAGYLHDIGSFIHNRAHHKHSEYVINSLSLFRLSAVEIKTIACIARYHRKGAPSPAHPLYNSLPPEHQLLVQKLCSLLRMANALDTSHRQKVAKLKVKVNPGQEVVVSAFTTDNFLLERAAFLAEKDYFEDITGAKVIFEVREQR